MSLKVHRMLLGALLFLCNNPLHRKCSHSKPSYGHLPRGLRPQPPECSTCDRSGHATAGDTVICTPAPPSDQKFSEDRHLVCFGHQYVPCTLSSATQWLPAGLRSKSELLTLTAKFVIWLRVGPRPHLDTCSVFPTAL